jgi:hypothetical protein
VCARVRVPVRVCVPVHVRSGAAQPRAPLPLVSLRTDRPRPRTQAIAAAVERSGPNRLLA